MMCLWVVYIQEILCTYQKLLRSICYRQMVDWVAQSNQYKRLITGYRLLLISPMVPSQQYLLKHILWHKSHDDTYLNTKLLMPGQQNSCNTLFDVLVNPLCPDKRVSCANDTTFSLRCSGTTNCIIPSPSCLPMYFLYKILLWPPCVGDADIIFLPCGFFLSIFYLLFLFLA